MVVFVVVVVFVCYVFVCFVFVCFCFVWVFIFLFFLFTGMFLLFRLGKLYLLSEYQLSFKTIVAWFELVLIIK